MPQYVYACTCGHREEVIREIRERNDLFLCPQCGQPMERDFAGEGGAVPVGTQTGSTFWSESLAISPDQATEHRQKFPDVLIDGQGRLGFTSHKQREKYLEACGFEKKPAKLKRR